MSARVVRVGTEHSSKLSSQRHPPAHILVFEGAVATELVDHDIVFCQVGELLSTVTVGLAVALKC